MPQRLAAAAFVHSTAVIAGEVDLGEDASLWPYVVIRAEAWRVAVGRGTNLQDFVMVHIGWETPTIIGAYCSITHRATLHGCTIGDNCLIGIGATVMDGAVIGDNSIVGQHAFVPEGFVAPPNSIVVGTPAKVMRSRNNFVANRLNALLYVRNARAYANGDHRAWTGEAYDAFVREERAGLEALAARLFGDEAKP